MTEEDLAEWRASPVADEVRAALRKSLATQRADCMKAYWNGGPWPEDQRKSLLRAIVILDDWFGSSAEDFKAMMEMEE